MQAGFLNANSTVPVSPKVEENGPVTVRGSRVSAIVLCVVHVRLVAVRERTAFPFPLSKLYVGTMMEEALLPSSELDARLATPTPASPQAALPWRCNGII